MTFPSPETRNPVLLPDGSHHAGTVFLSAAIDHPRFMIGDYTYASAHTPPDDWAAHIAPYLYDFSPEKLQIGKFCQFADGVKFITASANHRYDGFSTFPFMIFNGQGPDAPSMPDPGPDTIIGNDVWIGQGATILPGARIGNGVIISSGAVVSGTIPDYAIVRGNPGQVNRIRFDADTVAALIEIAWWDWDIADIVANESAIVGADLQALMNVAGQS